MFVIQTSLGLPNLNIYIKKKNEEDSGRSSKMTPSCKWRTEIAVITEANKDQSHGVSFQLLNQSRMRGYTIFRLARTLYPKN